jgi:hypothetical protein
MAKIVNERWWLPEADVERMLVEGYGMSLTAARDWLHNNPLPRKLVDIPDSQLPQPARWQRCIGQLGLAPDISSRFRRSVVDAAALAAKAGELRQTAHHDGAIRKVLQDYREQEVKLNLSKHRAWEFAQSRIPPGTTRGMVWVMYDTIFDKRGRGRPPNVKKY